MHMSRAIERVKEEIRKIFVVAVFFSTGFCLIHICTRLFTEGSNVQIASITRAIFGGLIVAKVLALVDVVPFVHAFPGKPLVHNIAWKSWLYVAGGAIFLYLEPFLKNLFRGAGLFVSHSRAWEELMLPRTWATLIFLAMLMIAFVTMQEMSRVIGKNEMKHMFFGARSNPPLEQNPPREEQSFRDAA